MAFAVFLIVMIQSLYQGFRSGAGEFAKQFPADAWVVQRGIADLARSSSQVPAGVDAQLDGLPGVRATVKARGRLLRLEVGNREDLAFFIAFEEGLATTVAMRSIGYSGPPATGDVIAHESIASTGDAATINGREFRVTGTYGGGIPIAGYSFMNYADAGALFGIPGFVNYVVVYLDDPSAATGVREAVQKNHPELEVLSGVQLSEYTGREVDSFLPVITVLLAIAFLVGAAVISLIIYTATIERARDYAILKAIGASNIQLYRIVLTQSFIVGVGGFVVGVPLALLVASYVKEAVPEFLTKVNWQAMIVVLAAVAGMSFVAAYVPTRRIASIDPASVFRA